MGMSSYPATRSRWLDWKPKAQVLADTAENEPTKPSERGIAGFEGATSPESSEIEAEPDRAELPHASAVLKERIFADTPETEATKPAIPGFAGLDGATSAESPNIESSAYRGILNRTGVRIMALESETAIGVWADLDGPEIRAALHVRGLDRYPLRYLDGTGVPMPHKLRMVKGDPVPKDVLAAMEQNPAEPWKVRDRMLNEMGWCPKQTDKGNNR
jgi:hypothetical protein